MVSITSAIAVLGSVGTFAGILSTWYYQKQTEQLLEEKRRITWDDLPREANVLRDDVESEFDPDLLVTPGTRGATIVNLMFGVSENILLYVGIREDQRGKNELPDDPENYLALPKTGKYHHYLPDGLDEEDKEQSVLIVDDFVDSGDSMETFREFLVDLGFDRENIRTATIVTTETAINANKNPDYYALRMTRPFYFPWGKAV